MKEINAAALTTYDIARDGQRVRIRVRDQTDEEAALVLPTESVSELMMTLPKMLQTAIRRQHRDPSLRLVHELSTYSVERLAGEEKLILTLHTPDGFEVSFALTDTDPGEFGANRDNGAGNTARYAPLDVTGAGSARRQ